MKKNKLNNLMNFIYLINKNFIKVEISFSLLFNKVVSFQKSLELKSCKE